jgi:hypothetical protein
VAKQPHQPRPVAAAGCKHSGPRELRCAGQGVVRLEIALTRARTTSVTLQEVRVPVVARGSGGVNGMFVRGTPDFMYDGGPSRDNVNVESPDDGTAGQDAWVGSDVENASILGEPQSGDDLVIGNEGPNVLVGPGTVRGLGGNDILVSDGYAGGGTTLDGRDADDRIDALAWLPDRLPARADPPHHPLSASEHNPPFRVDGDGNGRYSLQGVTVGTQDLSLRPSGLEPCGGTTLAPRGGDHGSSDSDRHSRLSDQARADDRTVRPGQWARAGRDRGGAEAC